MSQWLATGAIWDEESVGLGGDHTIQSVNGLYSPCTIPASPPDPLAAAGGGVAPRRARGCPMSRLRYNTLRSLSVFALSGAT